MPYDPAKITPAPPRYVPRDEDDGPTYDDSNPPTARDYLRAANEARKTLKKLKP